MADATAAMPRVAGWRVVSDVAAIAIRHFPGDTSACDAVRQVGLGWADLPGELIGTDPWLAWRSPQESIAFGLERERLQPLLERLAPGRSDSAVAMDLSDALGVIELHGSRLDEWLARLVDAMSVPRRPGRCARTDGRCGGAAAATLGGSRMDGAGPAHPCLRGGLARVCARRGVLRGRGRRRRRRSSPRGYCSEDRTWQAMNFTPGRPSSTA